jgi:ankyrin repeat protein
MRPAARLLVGISLLLASCMPVPVRTVPAAETPAAGKPPAAAQAAAVTPAPAAAPATAAAPAPSAAPGAEQAAEKAKAEWFQEYVTLKRYGLAIVEAPKEDTVGAETLVVVTSARDLDLMTAVWRPGSKTSISGMTRVEKSGTTWRCSYAFPETGDFLITLAVHPPDAKKGSYDGAAEWRLHAVVKPGERAAWLPGAGAQPGQPAQAQPADQARPEKLKAALRAAIKAGNVPAAKALLKEYESTEKKVKAAAMDAVKSALFDADRSAAKEAMKVLEAAGMAAGLVDEDGWALLHTAVMNDRIEVAEWLLNRGADVNSRAPGGSTALHLMCGDGVVPPEEQADWVRFLLGHGADINARTGSGGTPLLWAAGGDYYHNAIVSLVEAGANFDLGDDEGNAPLSYATQHAAVKNRDYLRTRGAKLYSYSFPVANDAPACKAVLKADMAALGSIPAEDLSTLVARTSELVPATPLHLAVEQGGMPVLKALCARKVDWNVPDRYGRSPLELAVREGRTEVVSLLLDNGADPNYAAAGRSSAFAVAIAVNQPLARLMLARGLTPRGEGIAEAAVSSEDLELVKALGAKLEWSDKALLLAAQTGQVEITEHLASLDGVRGRTLRYYGLAEISLDGEVLSLPQLVEVARRSRERNAQYAAKAAAVLEAPERKGGISAQRGAFPYTLESWSPWLECDKEAKLADYPVGVYVPKDYDGKKPFGLVVSMTNAKSSSRYPRDFAATLDRHHLIWVGFDPYNGLNRLGGNANAAFCLAAVYNMLGHFAIDQSRIYVGGYSLGGQMTEALLRTHAWVFDGAFFINIGYTGAPPYEPGWHYLKHHAPIVYAEGDYDYNRTGAYADYEGLLCGGYRSTTYFHEPMKGHLIVSAAGFERIVTLMEAGRK